MNKMPSFLPALKAKILALVEKYLDSRQKLNLLFPMKVVEKGLIFSYSGGDNGGVIF